jgi:hypothetical protein
LIEFPVFRAQLRAKGLDLLEISAVARDLHHREPPMESIQANIGKLETQLEQWGTKLDELVVRAEAAGAEAKDDSLKRLAELKTKHQAAQARLDEFKVAGAEKWETFKGGIENAWHEIETAFKKLKN